MLDLSKDDVVISITIARLSPTLNACGKILEVLTSISLDTHVASKGLDPLMQEAEGTDKVITVIK